MRLWAVLHVRPVLDMKKPDDVQTMRNIAEEAFELVKNMAARTLASMGMALFVLNLTR